MTIDTVALTTVYFVWTILDTWHSALSICGPHRYCSSVLCMDQRYCSSLLCVDQRYCSSVLCVDHRYCSCVLYGPQIL